MYFSRVGYDTIINYSKEELIDLYLNEGKSLEEATKLAEELYRELNRLTIKEKRSWKRCRKREICVGDGYFSGGVDNSAGRVHNV